MCAFFKAGTCKRGNKCRYSHDLGMARKGPKINLYMDPREKEADTMDKWDQSKLEQVVTEKAERRPNQTDIVRRAHARTHARCQRAGSSGRPSRADLQVLPGRHRDTEVRLVLGLPQRRRVHLPACATARLRAQDQGGEEGGDGRREPRHRRGGDRGGGAVPERVPRHSATRGHLRLCAGPRWRSAPS